MTHDPLCPSVTACDCRHDDCCFCDSDVWCMCDLIAKVRADERQRATTAKATVHVCVENNCWCRVLAAIREAKP